MPVTPFTLRDHFPPVSTASWIRAIQEIGSDPGSLHWVRDGIKLRLFYRASDSAVAQRIDATPGWEKCQRIDAAEYGSSTGNLIGLVQDGSMAVNVQTARGARFDGKSREFVKQLTAAGLAVHWTGPVSGIVEVMRESVRDPRSVGGSILSDPLTIALSGRAEMQYGDLLSLVGNQSLPNVRTIAIDATVFAPMAVVDQLASVLGTVSEILAQLTGRGVPADTVAATVSVRIGLGTDFFLEVAKLRALRKLLEMVFAAYGTRRARPHVFAEASPLYHSLLDPELNLVRATTQAVSGIWGGADTLCVPPLPELSLHLPMHLQLLLDHEARCGWTADPMHGSYFVEYLTDALGHAAWALFREQEDSGGLWQEYLAGSLQSRISRAAEQRRREVNVLSPEMVGVNIYSRSRDGTPTIGYGRDFEAVRIRLQNLGIRVALIGTDPSLKSLAIRLLKSLGLQWEEALPEQIRPTTNLIVIAGTSSTAEISAHTDIPVLAVLPSKPDGPTRGATRCYYPGLDIPATMNDLLSFIGMEE